MASLKYKTRAMQNPKGLPRVYFCCHPLEFSALFEEISEEILKKQNCALWYRDESDPYDEEEHLSYLSEMQLFVMPVTTRLLTTENRALSVEFRFAVEHHIPVLPLMQESGLAEVFNKKCGDLQFLDKYARDDTAISYDEKLEKYLSGVLLGDGLREKVRAAFDAYVFLSYRKKDRKYAQELMRLIHKNEFCRDIAIWYDEFLTPGENFNDAIREALEKSGLFILAVTPNLINEINYVMTTEYPMARETGKPILPAEMVATDRDALREKYEDIPDCTDPREGEAFARALIEYARSIAIDSNNDDPEHNFFIGLAYLDGIDVEVDHEKALSLIIFAAERGVVEACEQLVQMYRTGKGVERNYETAIRWQEKKIVFLLSCYEKEDTEGNAYNAFMEMIRCGDYHTELGKLSLAKKMYIEAESFAMSMHMKYCSRSGKYGLAISCERLGDIYMAEGDLKRAGEYYEKNLEMSSSMAESTDPESISSLAISYGKLGELCATVGDICRAKAYYERFLEIAYALAKESGTADAQRYFYICYGKLGDLCLEDGDLSGAKNYYEKALKTADTALAVSDATEARRDLAICYDRLGNVCKKGLDLKSARSYYEKYFEISETLLKETDMIVVRRDLFVAAVNLGGICLMEDKVSEAREYYEIAFDIADFIAKKAGTVESYLDLCVSYDKLGDASKKDGNIDLARRYYEKGYEIRTALARENDTLAVRRDLIEGCNKLGAAYAEEGDINAARVYYEKALETAEIIYEVTNTVESLWDIAVINQSLGDLCGEYGDVCAAREYYRKAYEISDLMAKKANTPECRVLLAVSLCKLGLLSEDGLRLKYLKMSYEIYDGLSVEYPELDIFSDGKDYLNELITAE